MHWKTSNSISANEKGFLFVILYHRQRASWSKLKSLKKKKFFFPFNTFRDWGKSLRNSPALRDKFSMMEKRLFFIQVFSFSDFARTRVKHRISILRTFRFIAVVELNTNELHHTSKCTRCIYEMRKKKSLPQIIWISIEKNSRQKKVLRPKNKFIFQELTKSHLRVKQR